MQPTFHVLAKWDPEAGVWYTAECSIKGINTEADTLEALRDRLMLIIPDFLEDKMPAAATLHLVAEQDFELVPQAAE